MGDMDGEKLEGDGGETVIKIDCIRKQSVFSKRQRNGYSF